MDNPAAHAAILGALVLIGLVVYAVRRRGKGDRDPSGNPDGDGSPGRARP